MRGGRRKAPVTAAEERQSRANRERAREPGAEGAGGGRGTAPARCACGALGGGGGERARCGAPPAGGGWGPSGAGGREQETPRAAVRPSAERSAVGRPAAGAVSTRGLGAGCGGGTAEGPPVQVRIR